jgi:hypothetical protein
MDYDRHIYSTRTRSRFTPSKRGCRSRCFKERNTRAYLVESPFHRLSGECHKRKTTSHRVRRLHCASAAKPTRRTLGRNSHFWVEVTGKYRCSKGHGKQQYSQPYPASSRSKSLSIEPYQNQYHITKSIGRYLFAPNSQQILGGMFISGHLGGGF